MGIRWKCDRCGSAVNGPEKPRKDDVCRFCLSCSEQTKRLVQRFAPTLEKRREVAKAKEKERSKKAKAREKKRLLSKWTIDGLHVHDELKRLFSLYKEEARRLPELELRKSEKRDEETGRATYSDWRIVMTVGATCDQARAIALLVHEFAHLILPEYVNHGTDFSNRLASMYRKAYGIDTPANIHWREREKRFILLFRERSKAGMQPGDEKSGAEMV